MATLGQGLARITVQITAAIALLAPLALLGRIFSALPSAI